MPTNEETRYLTTDFEIMSINDLTSIVEALEEDTSVLFNGKWGNFFKASFEAPIGSDRDPNNIIAYFYELITFFKNEERQLYDSCFSKIFDVGFESGNSNSCYFTELRETTVKKLAEMNAKIGVTIYPYASPPNEKEEYNH